MDESAAEETTLAGEIEAMTAAEREARYRSSKDPAERRLLRHAGACRVIDPALVEEHRAAGVGIHPPTKKRSTWER